MWLPVDPETSPLKEQGEVSGRTFPLFVLNDNQKTLSARANVSKLDERKRRLSFRSSLHCIVSSHRSFLDGTKKEVFCSSAMNCTGS